MPRAFVSKGTLSVQNLAELRKAISELADAKGIKKALKDANYHAAQKTVLRAQAIAVATGRRAAIASASTLKARRTEANASIRLGSDEMPQALGQEFGAYHDVQRKIGRKGWNQFPLFKGKGEGYFLMPAIGEMGEGEIGEEYLDAIENIINEAFK